MDNLNDLAGDPEPEIIDGPADDIPTGDGDHLSMTLDGLEDLIDTAAERKTDERLITALVGYTGVARLADGRRIEFPIHELERMRRILGLNLDDQDGQTALDRTRKDARKSVRPRFGGVTDGRRVSWRGVLSILGITALLGMAALWLGDAVQYGDQPDPIPVAQEVSVAPDGSLVITEIPSPDPEPAPEPPPVLEPDLSVEPPTAEDVPRPDPEPATTATNDLPPSACTWTVRATGWWNMREGPGTQHPIRNVTFPGFEMCIVDVLAQEQGDSWFLLNDETYVHSDAWPVVEETTK